MHMSRKCGGGGEKGAQSARWMKDDKTTYMYSCYTRDHTVYIRYDVCDI